jgi:hypothetical protein
VVVNIGSRVTGAENLTVGERRLCIDPSPNDGFRRISPAAVRPCEGRLTET